MLSIHFSWFCSFIAEYMTELNIILSIHCFCYCCFCLLLYLFSLFTCSSSIFRFLLADHLWKILLIHKFSCCFHHCCSFATDLFCLVACSPSIKETQVLNAKYIHYFLRKFKAQMRLLLQKEVNSTMLPGSKKVEPTLKMFIIQITTSLANTAQKILRQIFW